MKEVRIGLMGCGNMGKSLANGVKGLTNARVAAVCDVDAERAKETGDSLGAQPFTSFEELAASEEIDAVIVASPPFMHKPMVVAAAENGKHVFCEKPMAPKLEDCDAMIEACKKSGVRLMIGQVCRYHGIHSKVRELVHSGRFGKPTAMFVARLSAPWTRSATYNVPWRLKMAESGGTLMEINAHEIDFMRFVCGDAAEVYAVGGNYVQKAADYPDVAFVSIKFKSSAVGLLHSSQASAVGAYGGRVDCEEGSLAFPTIWGQNGGIRMARFGEQEEFLPASEIKVESPVRRELREFVESILEERVPAIPGEEGRAAVEIALAAYQSIETGKPVSLPL